MTYIQHTLDGLDLPFPEIPEGVMPISSSQTAERGAIFTKREVVDFMLDLAGYSVEEDLTQASLLEPSFGQGDFLFVAIERLLTSFVQHHGPLLNIVPLLRNAIRAVELHQETFASIRNKLLLFLQERCIGQQE